MIACLLVLVAYFYIVYELIHLHIFQIIFNEVKGKRSSRLPVRMNLAHHALETRVKHIPIDTYNYALGFGMSMTSLK